MLTDRDFSSADAYAGRKSGLRVACHSEGFHHRPHQIWEARAPGADAILLIVACLERPLLGELYAVAMEAGLDVPWRCTMARTG